MAIETFMATKKGNRIHAAVYIDEPVYFALQRLSKESRIPVQAYLREAIADLLAKYKVKVAKQKIVARGKE